MKLHPRSVYFKLFLAYGLAFLLLALGAFLIREISTTQPNYEISKAHLETYVRYLAQTLGDPPQIAKAQSLAQTTGLHIALWGPHLNWSHPQRFLAMAQDHPTGQVFEIPLDLSWWKDSGEAILTIQRGPYFYAFSEFHADHRLSPWLAALAFLTVLTALSASFFLVRFFLRPLKQMCHIALQWGAHNWMPRIAPTGHDELALLGRTLDQMADQIERDFQASQELLTAVSHDIRSPLTRLRLNCEMLPASKSKKALIEEIRYLDDLTGALLDQRRLSQAGALHRESFSLHDWLEQTLKPWQNQTEVALKVLMSGKDHTVQLDRTRLTQALTNLLENAKKFRLGELATVTVSLTPPPECSQGFFLLEVSDQGPGVHEAVLPRLGEPFFQLERSRRPTTIRGYGLGLSLVRSIVKAHGGQVTFQNRQPQGLAVQLKLPLTS